MGRIRTYLMWRFVNRNPRLRRLLLSTVPNRDEDVVLFGSRLRVNAREEIGYARAAKLAQRSAVMRDESGVLATLCLLLEPGDTFIDVGANVGLYSAVIARAKRNIYGRMKMYAFEPNPDTVRRLRETLKGEDVEIFDCALSNRDGELEFCEAAGSCSFGVKSRANPFQISGRTLRLAARRLDTIEIAGDSIVLKIDAETHEREVVEGASGLIRAGRLKAVYVDGYEDRLLPDYFRSAGFELFDGRTLAPGVPAHSLLAIHSRHLERWGRRMPYVAAQSA